MEETELELKEETQEVVSEEPTATNEIMTEEPTVPNIEPQKPKPWVKRHKKLLIFLGVLFAIGLSIGIAAIIDGVNGIKVLGDFVSDQILGMKWLNTLLGMAFTGMFGADFMATRWGGAIQFFIYDTMLVYSYLYGIYPCRLIERRYVQFPYIQPSRRFGRVYSARKRFRFSDCD